MFCLAGPAALLKEHLICAQLYNLHHNATYAGWGKGQKKEYKFNNIM